MALDCFMAVLWPCIIIMHRMHVYSIRHSLRCLQCVYTRPNGQLGTQKHTIIALPRKKLFMLLNIARASRP